MGTTVKLSEMGNPQLRVRVRGGKWGFIKVGQGNPDAIKAQRDVLTSCAKSAKGLKGTAFRQKVSACMRK